MQVLAGWEQVAREPVGMSRGHLFDALFSFRRVSPLQLDQGASFRLAEKTKSGGTASFRPDTKGVFLFLYQFLIKTLNRMPFSEQPSGQGPTVNAEIRPLASKSKHTIKFPVQTFLGIQNPRKLRRRRICTERMRTPCRSTARRFSKRVLAAGGMLYIQHFV